MTTETAIEAVVMEIGKTRNVNINKKIRMKKVVTKIEMSLRKNKAIITKEEITKIKMIIIEMKIVEVIEASHEEIIKIEEEAIKVVKAA